MNGFLASLSCGMVSWRFFGGLVSLDDWIGQQLKANKNITLAIFGQLLITNITICNVQDINLEY
jgi:hypothetical protein